MCDTHTHSQQDLTSGKRGRLKGGTGRRGGREGALWLCWEKINYYKRCQDVKVCTSLSRCCRVLSRSCRLLESCLLGTRLSFSIMTSANTAVFPGKKHSLSQVSQASFGVWGRGSQSLSEIEYLDPGLQVPQTKEWNSFYFNTLAPRLIILAT